MALSPDGTSLAADIGLDYSGSHLVVFNLATGNERAWSFKTCAQCNPSSGGLGYGGVNVDALSWTGDSHHVAFVEPNRRRVADTQYSPAARRDRPGLGPAGQQQAGRRSRRPETS